MKTQTETYLRRIQKAVSEEEKKAIAAEFHSLYATLDELEKQEVRAVYQPILEEEKQGFAQLETMIGTLEQKYGRSLTD